MSYTQAAGSSFSLARYDRDLIRADPKNDIPKGSTQTAMAYRIHFTVQDLARTRVAEAPMPLHELELAARALQSRSQPTRLDAWRNRARTQLSPQARMALALMPSVGSSPNFLSPTKAGTIEQLLEQIRATPRALVKADVIEAALHHPSLPTWAHQLSEDPSLFAELCTGLGHLHACLLAPNWGQLTEHLAADQTLRLQHILTGGVDQLLTQANPRWMRWNPPVLEIRMANGAERDLYLEGQGLLLIPSMFGTRAVVTESQPVSVSYPAYQDPHELAPVVSAPGQKRSPGVATLLGRTRTAVLATIAEHQGCSTKELAALSGVASASASEHATILREAGLIRSLRHRNSVRHSLTALGLALLNTPGSH